MGQKFDFRMDKKTSSLMLLDHWSASVVAQAFWYKEVCQTRAPQRPNFALLRSTPGLIWPKNYHTCRGPRVLHTYQVSSKPIQQFWKVENVNC